MPSSLGLLGSCCLALAATPARLVRPRRADPGLLAALHDAGAPPARATVRLTALPQARQSAPATIVAEGARSLRSLVLGMTTFVVEHPRARFLVDPAICTDVHRRVLPELPAVLRPVVAPERPVRGLVETLERAGHRGGDVDFALATHLHWDHVSGLLELPGLPLRVTAPERADALDGPAPPPCVARGPLAGHPIDAITVDGPPVLTFSAGHDLFGDGAVVLVDLAGHTPGSVGVLLALEDGSRVLLAGDAVWHREQVRLLREKAPFPGRVVDHDRDAAFASVARLHALPRGVTVVASHDRDAATPWVPAALASG